MKTMGFIPARAWLVLLIAILAYRPAAYLAWRMADVSLPGASFEQARNPRIGQKRLTFNLVWLAVLIAFAVFAFSQAAVDLVHSPRFPPLMMAGCTAFGLYFTGRGIVTGEMEPMARGSVFDPYNRSTQPRRYWLSLAWNVLITALCGFLIFKA